MKVNRKNFGKLPGMDREFRKTFRKKISDAVHKEYSERQKTMKEVASKSGDLLKNMAHSVSQLAGVSQAIADIAANAAKKQAASAAQAQQNNCRQSSHLASTNPIAVNSLIY